jgi:DNA repair photolyase
MSCIFRFLEYNDEQRHQNRNDPDHKCGLVFFPMRPGEEAFMQASILFKVDKRRVLVPVGEPCPFGCRYCYTRGGEVSSTRVKAADILTRFQHFAATSDRFFETIQFGYDGDPFARPERGISMLRELALMGKHLNFSTKAALTRPTLDALNEINQQMSARGNTLSALVSLSCWDSAAQVEPHTPSPQERLQTVTHLKNRNIPVFIAVRPVLPHISDSEYERLACEGIRAGADGFILGPLYTNDRGQFVRFIPSEILAAVPSRKKTVSWSPHSPMWTRYEEEARLQWLTRMIESYGGRVFHSSADAMDLLSAVGSMR